MSDLVAVKIESYSVTKMGHRRLSTGLPPLWVSDLGIKAGDKLDVYRTTDDRLVICCANTPREEAQK